MNGVTVIAEHTVKNVSGDYYLLLIFCGLFAIELGALTICAIREMIDDHRNGGPVCADVILAIIFVCSCLFFSFGFVAFATEIAKGGTHTEYTITLDESASYLEFTEKYEVLSEEDGVYRVREKSDDNI